MQNDLGFKALIVLFIIIIYLFIFSFSLKKRLLRRACISECFRFKGAQLRVGGGGEGGRRARELPRRQDGGKIDHHQLK